MQYKIVHQSHDAHSRVSETAEQQLYVYTVGGGKDWTRVHHACAVHGVSYGDPVCIDGVVYWCTREVRGLGKLARYDLATGEITSVERRWVNALLPADGVRRAAVRGHHRVLRRVGGVVPRRGRLLGAQPRREAASRAAPTAAARPATGAPAAARRGGRRPVRSQDQDEDE